MFVVDLGKDKTLSLAAKEVTPAQAKTLGSKLAAQILRELSVEPNYPKAVAKKLKVHEQKVYYHMRRLEKAGIIEIQRTVLIGGTPANVYGPTSSAFVIVSGGQSVSVPVGMVPGAFLEPFIENGILNATIIVGSPDPHGPEMARSRDGYYGIDFALFLGTFLKGVTGLCVKLDTEVTSEDLQRNLVLIGGPVVNTVTAKINDSLPVRFQKQEHWAIYSTLSKQHYYGDETGIIVKAKNPFNRKKMVLVVAGKRYSGTRSVMIACIKHLSEIVKGNRKDPLIIAKVIEGVDRDSDGIVDEVRILE